MFRSPEASWERARELILRYGWNATAYQLLNPGIELWFPAAGEGVVGFVRYHKTLVVGGAPVCDLTHLPAIAREFREDARSRGQHVCYFGAGERLDSQYAENSKWSRVLLGSQPTWDPKNWSDCVSKRSSLRAQFNRARNKGIAVREWQSDAAENHPALRRCLVEWLETRHLPPLHFMVEPETLNTLADRRVFVAESKDGEVVGFTILSPVPARNGWLVEQIVRGFDAPNGTAELLIDTAIRAVAADGAAYATLGLSPLSTRAESSPISQPLWLALMLRWVRVHGRRFYNFDGLDSFKAKFNPEAWEPIYAIADSPRFPPRALNAVAGAFSGGAPIRLVATALYRAAVEELKALFGDRSARNPQPGNSRDHK